MVAGAFFYARSITSRPPTPGIIHVRRTRTLIVVPHSEHTICAS